MGGRKRHYHDLESGDFVIEAPAAGNNVSLLMDDEDDQVSGLSDPSHQLQTVPPPVEHNNTFKSKISYLKRAASKKLLHSSQNKQQQQQQQQPLTETTNLLGDLIQEFQEEQEDRDSLLNLMRQPSPNFFLSIDDLRDEDSHIFHDETSPRNSPIQGIYSTFKSLAKDLNKEKAERHPETSSRPPLAAVLVSDCKPNMYTKQETLFIGILIAYIILGGFLFSYILEPSWEFLDAIYFCVLSVFTVRGDGVKFTTKASVLFYCVYTLLGSASLIILGFCRFLKSRETRAHTVTDNVLRTIDSSRPKQRQLAFKFGFLKVLAWLWLPFVVATLSGWTYLETIYYFVFTICTVGQDNVIPNTPAAKIMAIAFVPMAVTCMFQGLGIIANSLFARKKNKQVPDVFKNDNTNPTMTRAEFLELVLFQMDKLDPELILELRQKYNTLQSNNYNAQELRSQLLQT